MTKFPQVVIFPHIKLTPEQAAVLPSLCDRADILVPDGRTDRLSSLVKPYTLDVGASEKVLQSYRELKKFGDEVLAQNASSGEYVAVDSLRAPVYDHETPLRIVSDFRAATDADAAGPEISRQALAAAVTLLLSEDVQALQNEAHKALAGIGGKSQAMWQNLKGAPDPLQLNNEALPPYMPDDGLMKKRLTAWSILAKMLLLTNIDVWLTFEKPVLDLCLAVFMPEKPLKEITFEKARAVFYQLPLTPQSFAAWLADTDAAYVHDSGAAMIIGFVELPC